MFILLKVNSTNELPLEEQISEILVNTENINYLTSLPGSGVAVVFNSPSYISEQTSNMLVVNASLDELMVILKEKGLM